MDKVNKNTTRKSERLGWEQYSSKVPVETKNIIGNGVKVKKNTYCNVSVNYRKLVP